MLRLKINYGSTFETKTFSGLICLDYYCNNSFTYVGTTYACFEISLKLSIL